VNSRYFGLDMVRFAQYVTRKRTPDRELGSVLRLDSDPYVFAHVRNPTATIKRALSFKSNAMFTRVFSKVTRRSRSIAIATSSMSDSILFRCYVTLWNRSSGNGDQTLHTMRETPAKKISPLVYRSPSLDRRTLAGFGSRNMNLALKTR
jgi:hypothetical protein